MVTLQSEVISDCPELVFLFADEGAVGIRKKLYDMRFMHSLRGMCTSPSHETARSGSITQDEAEHLRSPELRPVIEIRCSSIGARCADEDHYVQAANSIWQAIR